MPDLIIDRATDALIGIDIQNDFCPGGALAAAGGDQVVAPTNALIAAFDHVLLTQDWHPAGHSSFASSHAGANPYDSIEAAYGPQTLWPDHCVQGSEGAAFHADLDRDRAELIIRKGYRRGIDSYSAFYENDHATPTGLTGYLRERGFERLFLTGLAADFCVAFSALDAIKEGFEVFVVEDACRAIDLGGSLAAAWEDMTAAGVRRIDSAALRAG
jgi:nicotinamidase/pyrazinamidase